MTGAGGDFEDGRDESNVIPTASRRRPAASELNRFHLGPCDVNGYESDDGGDLDADVEQEASQADDGSTQNVED